MNSKVKKARSVFVDSTGLLGTGDMEKIYKKIHKRRVLKKNRHLELVYAQRCIGMRYKNFNTIHLFLMSNFDHFRVILRFLFAVL